MTEPVEQAVAQDAVEVPEETDLTPTQEAETPAEAGAPAPAAEAADGEATAAELEARVAELEALAAERTEDLQRVQAEYVNYKRRVDRDRALARQGGVEAVLRDLMPVFDAIRAAESHADLTGGFRLTADELIKVTKSYGFESFGEVGDEFDPRLHEALMQVPDPDTDTMRVHEVMQVGFRLNELVLRPARVVVAVPQE